MLIEDREATQLHALWPCQGMRAAWDQYLLLPIVVGFMYGWMTGICRKAWRNILLFHREEKADDVNAISTSNRIGRKQYRPGALTGGQHQLKKVPDGAIWVNTSAETCFTCSTLATLGRHGFFDARVYAESENTLKVSAFRAINPKNDWVAQIQRDDTPFCRHGACFMDRVCAGLPREGLV
jgi:hypothetical protein